MRREIRAVNTRKEINEIKKKRKQTLQMKKVDELFDDLDQLEKEQLDKEKKDIKLPEEKEYEVIKDWKNEKTQLHLLKDVFKVLKDVKSLEIKCPNCKEQITPFQG